MGGDRTRRRRNQTKGRDGARDGEGGTKGCRKTHRQTDRQTDRQTRQRETEIRDTVSTGTETDKRRTIHKKRENTDVDNGSFRQASQEASPIDSSSLLLEHTHRTIASALQAGRILPTAPHIRPDATPMPQLPPLPPQPQTAKGVHDHP